MIPLVPPIKCQGIKTKLVGAIKAICADPAAGRWVEPFCGSCAVVLNVRPQRALLCDTNLHIVRVYKDIQSRAVCAGSVREYLSENGSRLQHRGEDVYYDIRDRFNESPDSFAFIFLNRACFNGILRFNRKGGFNVPFCRKPQRFSAAYITKICNQIGRFSQVLRDVDWEFRCADFRETLTSTAGDDIVYADPPYAGRHADYYNSWSESDEAELAAALKSHSGRFLLSTWLSNQYRTNPRVEAEWSRGGYYINRIEHFYHVGPTEDRRNPMTEALISNFEATLAKVKKRSPSHPQLFDTVQSESP